MNAQEHLQGLPRSREATPVRAVAFAFSSNLNYARFNDNFYLQRQKTIYSEEKSQIEQTENKIIMPVISTAYLPIFLRNRKT